MNILITGASTPLSRHLASALGGRHMVTLTDIADVPGVEGFVRCDLDHDDATNDLVRGTDVIVHSGGIRRERGCLGTARHRDEALLQPRPGGIRGGGAAGRVPQLAVGDGPIRASALQ